MIEKTPSGVAMSASVRSGLMVVVAMELLLAGGCGDRGDRDGCRSGLQRDERRADNARLGQGRELKMIDCRGLGATHTGHARPPAAGYRASVRPDDAVHGTQEGACLDRRVAGGGRPYGGRAGVVMNPQDDFVTGRA